MYNFVYLLRCAGDTIYCGWTNDLARRVAAHNAGTGGKYTRSRLPAELVWYTVSETKEEAMSLEFHIKRLTRKQKERLVGGESSLTELLAL